MQNDGGYFIANVSWGKDSTAMLHLLLDRGDQLDEVVFYDTGAEFDAVYAERDRMLPLLSERGVRYTELRPRRPFFFDMLAKTVRHRDGTESQGYGWCGGVCRWGTRAKADAIDRYTRKRGGANVRRHRGGRDRAHRAQPRQAHAPGRGGHDRGRLPGAMLC